MYCAQNRTLILKNQSFPFPAWCLSDLCKTYHCYRWRRQVSAGKTIHKNIRALFISFNSANQMLLLGSKYFPASENKQTAHWIPLCPTALILIESIQCLLYPIYFLAFSFITNIISTITTFALCHKLTNISHLLLLMCPEFRFGLQYCYNIPIQHREKWNLKLYFQRWRTEECLDTNGRNISALWAMLQITAVPSVKPLKNSSEHFPLREITSKWYFYSMCTFGSY